MLEAEWGRGCFGGLDWGSLDLLRMVAKRVRSPVMDLVANRLVRCASTGEGEVTLRDSCKHGARVGDKECFLACSLLCDLLGDSCRRIAVEGIFKRRP